MAANHVYSHQERIALRRQAKARGQFVRFYPAEAGGGMRLIPRTEALQRARRDRAEALRARRQVRDPQGFRTQFGQAVGQEAFKRNKRTFAQLRALQDKEYNEAQKAPNKEAYKDHRNAALLWAREMKNEYPDEYAAYMGSGGVAPEQLPDEPAKRHATLEELYAIAAQHPIPMKGGGYLDPKLLDRDTLEDYYNTLGLIDQDVGGDDPEEIIDDYQATPGPTPEQMAKLEQLEQQREQARQAKEAKAEAAKEERNVREWRKQLDKEIERSDREFDKRDAIAQAQVARAQVKEDKTRADAQAKAAVAAAARQKVINDAWLKTGQMVTQTGVRIAALPQPGGIGLLLVTILVIVFALVPMNSSGDTRLMLIWLAIRGKVQLPTSGKTDLTAGGMDSTGSLLQKAGQAVSGAFNQAGNAISQATTGSSQEAHADTTALELGLQATTGIPFPIVIPLAAGETTISIPFASLGGG